MWQVPQQYVSVIHFLSLVWNFVLMWPDLYVLIVELLYWRSDRHIHNVVYRVGKDGLLDGFCMQKISQRAKLNIFGLNNINLPRCELFCAELHNL